jgi:hypothetical protein
MDHVHERSKPEHADETDIRNDELPASYYYDDATNYETYRDDEDDEESSQKNNDQDPVSDVRSCRSAS